MTPTGIISSHLEFFDALVAQTKLKNTGIEGKRSDAARNSGMAPFMFSFDKDKIEMTLHCFGRCSSKNGS